MTPEDRAEKIDEIFCGCRKEISCGMFAMITAEIRAAVEEAEARGYAMAHTDRDGGYKTGKAEAYEEAAKIAESAKCGITYLNGDTCDYWMDAASEIRARAKEVMR